MFSFFRPTCYLCKGRVPRRKMRQYLNDTGKKIHICPKCVLYAERRAFRRA